MQTEQMKIEMVKLGTLVQSEFNPRTITDAKRAGLKNSLKDLGIFKPFLVADDGAVIGGNQRVAVLQSMLASGEIKSTFKVPIVRVKGDEARRRVVMLADNNEAGEWDWDALPDFISGLKDFDVDLLLTGFDEDMLSDLGELTSSDVDLDRYTGDDLVEEESDADKDSKADEYLTNKQAKFTCGNVRGNIPIELYKEFLSIFNSVSNDIGSTAIPDILQEMLARMNP